MYHVGGAESRVFKEKVMFTTTFTTGWEMMENTDNSDTVLL